MTRGRYAPSPTGELHLGNLRTALLAWLFARADGGELLYRIEDLDRTRVRPGSAEQQRADLESLGLTFDPPLVVQSERTAAYDAALRALAGWTYPCFCTRREIAEAASAPHGPSTGSGHAAAGSGHGVPGPGHGVPGSEGPSTSSGHGEAGSEGPSTSSGHGGPAPGGMRRYPGTCRDLSQQQRRERAERRPPAIRLRAEDASVTITDLLHGEVTGVADDIVLRRNDGTAAYNLAVVVDDADSGVDQVVRGEDLLESAVHQAYLAQLLGRVVPTYAHVPLVVNASGRLAKRDQRRSAPKKITLAALGEDGIEPAGVLGLLAASLGLAGPDEPVEPDRLLRRFDPVRLPREPWVWSGTDQ